MHPATVEAVDKAACQPLHPERKQPSKRVEVLRGQEQDQLAGSGPSVARSLLFVSWVKSEPGRLPDWGVGKELRNVTMVSLQVWC